MQLKYETEAAVAASVFVWYADNDMVCNLKTL